MNIPSYLPDENRLLLEAIEQEDARLDALQREDRRREMEGREWWVKREREKPA